MTTLYIKNMVCDRCKLVVKQELEKLGLKPVKVALGEVILNETDIADDLKNKIETALVNAGFERIDDRKARLIENIAHLSGQFKKVTGFTPSELKKSRKDQIRKPLDHVS